MKTVGSSTLAALQAAPGQGYGKRDFVSVYCWEFGGDPASFFFWDGLDTVDQDVVDPDSGSPESRTFEGSGALLGVGKIASTADLTIRRTEIRFSPLAASVASMVFGHRIRGAVIEIHRATLDVGSKLPVDPPPPAFVGFIDGAPDPRARAGEETELVIRAVSDTRRLTVSNPAKFDDSSVQARAEGDAFGLYAGVVGHWNIIVGGSE